MFGTAAYAQNPYASAPGAEFSAAVADTCTATDTNRAVFAARTILSEMGVAVDVAGAGALVRGGVVETVVADDKTATSFSISAAVSELVGSIDALGAATVFPARTADGFTATASVLALPTYSTRVVEGATLAELSATVLTAAAHTSVSATTADLTASGSNMLITVADAARGGAAPRATLRVPASTTDSANAAAALSANVTLPAQVQEQITATLETVVATAVFAATAAATMRASDVVLAMFLWNPINDDQVPVWTDVLRPTTITDEAVFGGANFGVTVFAGQVAALYDPSYTKWSRIDDRQTPNWAPVDAV